MSAVNIKLHGHLGEAIGSEWKLHVLNLSEAMRAIEILSKRRLYKYLMENDKKGAKYRVLINGKDFKTEKSLNAYETQEDIQHIRESELCLSSLTLKTIDIVPVIEGADAIVNIILGVILIIIGIIICLAPGAQPFGVALIMAGIGLVASGIVALLMEPPTFQDTRDIQGGGTSSYIFQGPQNTIREGGPVPLGYGELIVGSQVISASYSITDVLATQGALTT